MKRIPDVAMPASSLAGQALPLRRARLSHAPGNLPAAARRVRQALGLPLALVVLGAALAGGLMGCARGPAGPAQAQTQSGAQAAAPSQVTAQGRVVPVRSVALSSLSGGIVAEAPVAEGAMVSKGQVLLRLDTARQMADVNSAKAALAVTEAQLAKVKAGARREDVASAEAAVQASRASAEAAASAIAVARADAKTAAVAVEVAKAGRLSANGAVNTANANLLRVRADASAEEIAIAERRVEAAKNALWSVQAQRDAVCGRVGLQGAGGASQGDCDGAKSAVQSAAEQVRIAELTLQQVKNGARDQDIAVAAAQVNQLQGQVSAAEATILQAQGQVAGAEARVNQLEAQAAVARAQVAQSEAALARAKTGATAEEIALAQAQVQQAASAVERAQVAMGEAELRAPFEGIVAAVNPAPGEQLLPGAVAVQLADGGGWLIETDDLTELNVGRFRVGGEVTLVFEAIPDLTLTGKVVRIRTIGENKRGDITYTVTIAPSQQDARLKWNMTATVTTKGN